MLHLFILTCYLRLQSYDQGAWQMNLNCCLTCLATTFKVYTYMTLCACITHAFLYNNNIDHNIRLLPDYTPHKNLLVCSDILWQQCVEYQRLTFVILCHVLLLNFF